MSVIAATLISLLVCAFAAGFEGACAGKNVKPFFATLRFPRYAAPLWLWMIIGGCYYLIFFFLLFRLLRLSTHPARWYVALALILFMMIANGLTNYVIFRARDLYLSFIIGAIAPITDIALFVLLARLDRTAALAMIPYLLYRVYAVYWGYALWRANQSV